MLAWIAKNHSSSHPIVITTIELMAGNWKIHTNALIVLFKYKIERQIQLFQYLCCVIATR